MPNNFGNTPWSPSQIEFLKKNYLKHGQAYCAAYLHKSENAIRCKAKSLRIVRPETAWTDKEVEILRACWPHASYRELRHALKPRTQIAIVRKAHKLKLGNRLSDLLSANAAAKLLGVCIPEFLRITELGNVPYVLRNAGSAPPAAKQPYKHRRYDKTQVIKAGKDYYRRETAVQAAERKNWRYETLRNAAGKLGAYKILDEYKMYPEDWDQLCQRWEERKRQNRANAAKRNLEKYRGKLKAEAARLLQEAGYSVSAATSIVPTLNIPDTGNVPSTNSFTPATTPTASISGS